jgi:putative transposase
MSERVARGETVRKTYQEKLKPTPTQERELEAVLGRCRTLYNTALAQRIFLWKQRGVSVSRYQQEAELQGLRAALPEYGALHSHVVQDVLARLDKTYQAFFRRLATGEKPGFPRFHGRNRYHSFTYKEYGNGAWLDDGYLVLSKLGRIAVRWMESPDCGHHQDRHDPQSGGRVVCVVLLYRRAHSPATGDGA